MPASGTLTTIARNSTSNRRVQTGFACDGSIIDFVYEWLDDGVTLYPITAFRIDE